MKGKPFQIIHNQKSINAIPSASLRTPLSPSALKIIRNKKNSWKSSVCFWVRRRLRLIYFWKSHPSAVCFVPCHRHKKCLRRNRVSWRKHFCLTSDSAFAKKYFNPILLRNSGKKQELEKPTSGSAFKPWKKYFSSTTVCSGWRNVVWKWRINKFLHLLIWRNEKLLSCHRVSH